MQLFLGPGDQSLLTESKSATIAYCTHTLLRWMHCRTGPDICIMAHHLPLPASPLELSPETAISNPVRVPQTDVFRRT